MVKSKKIEDLEDEIRKLEGEIKEKEAAMPAHSVKVQMVQEIEDLEEELNIKRKKLRQIKSNN